MNRVVIIEEHEQGWDTFMRAVDTDQVQRPRRRWKTSAEAMSYAMGMIDGISYHTDQIVSHGIIYERLEDK